jgi:uncharacterized protein (DUF433 family)
MNHTMEVKNEAAPLGRDIVSDPKIYHGQPPFRGSRIFVEEVLGQTASGMAGEAIIEERHGNITKTAIAEAMQLANQFLLKPVEA